MRASDRIRELRRSGQETPAAPSPQHAPELANLARLRRALYRFLGAVFLPPRKDRHAQLLEAAQAMRAEQEALAGFYWYLPWRRLLDRLATEDPPSAGELATAYTSLFAVGPGGRPSCPPYASCYLDPDRSAAGWIPLLLEREYCAAGVALSPSLHEPPDHLSVELEYTAVLCEREAEAWEVAPVTGLRRVLRRERRFLEQFLGSWIPVFANQLVLRDTTGVYAAAAVACDALVRHDLDLLALLLDTLHGVHR
jgi:TorA maturation chaperone TorD